MPQRAEGLREQLRAGSDGGVDILSGRELLSNQRRRNWIGPVKRLRQFPG